MANEKIQEGDYVLIYLDARRTYMIKMQAGQTFHTHKGYLKLDELIGKEYGEPIKSSLGIYFTTLKPQLNRLHHEVQPQHTNHLPQRRRLNRHVQRHRTRKPSCRIRHRNRLINHSPRTLCWTNRQSLHLRATQRIPEKRRQKPCNAQNSSTTSR